MKILNYELNITSVSKRHTLASIIILLAVPWLLSACQALNIGNTNTEHAPSNETKAALGNWGVETRHIDPSFHPGDDFYRYVNNGWLNSAKIPEGLPRKGAFVDVFLKTETQIARILTDIQASTNLKGSPEQQLADLFRSFINIEKRNALGISAISPQINQILKSQDLSTLAGLSTQPGFNKWVPVGVEKDPGNPERYVLTISQGGIGLPSRDYYLNSAEPYVEIRKAYLQYISDILSLANIEQSDRLAKQILAFEKGLAQQHWKPEQARDIVANYSLMSLDELKKFAPNFPWGSYFTSAGFTQANDIWVATDSAIQGIAKQFSSQTLDTLKYYTLFHYINNQATVLSESTDKLHFDFFQTKLAGITDQRETTLKAIRLLNMLMGEQLGRLYTQHYFPPESKKAMQELVGYVRNAFKKRLLNNPWMDAKTKEEALLKLAAFRAKIGYPDQWKDMSTVEIDPNDLVGNVSRIVAWIQEDEVKKLDEPIRDWEWQMNPQTINAYYSNLDNEIVFPAAILQPPFFDINADMAVNYGAIGMVIGHEFGHGFDDQGSRLDGHGEIKDWWQPRARRNFEALTKRLITQYNQYSVLPELKVNGALTLGENIGDLGGITIAFDAYQKYAEQQLTQQTVADDNFTPEQRFFLSYGQLWRNLTQEAALRQQVLADPHSPGEFRVNGILKNFTPWYKAFHVKPDNALYLPEEERIMIW